jgi:beta-galactosidase
MKGELSMGWRERISFDWDWTFWNGEAPGAEEPSYDDSGWRGVSLPHDWSIEGPFEESNPTGGDGGYVSAGTGWYRKSFDVPESWAGRRVTVEFDGVYMNSQVWINGRYLGRWPYGYTSFHYDLTPYLRLGGHNVMVVRVDNADQPHSRWYTGSGIYRHTWLTVTDPVHVERWGVYVTTPVVTASSADVHVRSTVRNGSDRKETVVVVRSRIFASDDTPVGSAEAQIVLEADASSETSAIIQVDNPQLWSIHSPTMYRVVTTVVADGQVVDETVTPFGIRTIAFGADDGFLLNGQRVKINGVCLHHDGGCVGASVPERVWERRLEALKRMGCNGIRMSHNPPAPELLDLCDQMGFLVMDEAFDEWTISKNKNGDSKFGYYEYFDDWAEKDLIAMLRRDRNHPSIVLWSIGNEIPDQMHPEGHLTARKLMGICRTEDPTRPVTAACDNIESEPKAATEAFLNTLDIVGYNYVNRWRTRTETYYAEDRHRYPARKFIGSENIGLGGVRGEYSWSTPSASPWRGPYYSGMINTEQLWKFTRMHDYVAGDFMWTGIDYLGETRWPSKNASSGVIDMCGFEKDGYYFYQSQWTEEPMAHLFPHWNWKGMEGKVIPVICYTNCDSAELIVNGRSFGEKSYEFPRQGMTREYGHFEQPYRHVATSDLHLSWDVPYEPGVLRLLGRNNGEVVIDREISTTDEASSIRLVPDRDSIAADGRDICHVRVEMVDAKGQAVPDANDRITFRIEGEGRLIGTDNGQPDCLESMQSPVKNAFNGLCLAIVQSTRDEGEIRITAEAEGLFSATTTIRTIKGVSE